jgi:hypothetical protein
LNFDLALFYPFRPLFSTSVAGENEMRRGASLLVIVVEILSLQPD